MVMKAAETLVYMNAAHCWVPAATLTGLKRAPQKYSDVAPDPWSSLRMPDVALLVFHDCPPVRGAAVSNVPAFPPIPLSHFWESCAVVALPSKESTKTKAN